MLGAHKFAEAEAMLLDAWETSIKVEGPDGYAVSHATVPYWMSLMFQKKTQEAKAFKARAEALGCDVKECDIKELTEAALEKARNGMLF